MKSLIKKAIGRFGGIVFGNAFSELANKMNITTQEVQILLFPDYVILCIVYCMGTFPKSHLYPLYYVWTAYPSPD